MRSFILLLVGALLGSTMAYAIDTLYTTIDNGISKTYRCVQLAREADARTSAEKLLQHLLQDMNLSDLRAVADAVGLRFEQFDKWDMTVALIGRDPQTASLTFNMIKDKDIIIQPLPGIPPCAR